MAEHVGEGYELRPAFESFTDLPLLNVRDDCVVSIDRETAGSNSKAFLRYLKAIGSPPM